MTKAGWSESGNVGKYLILTLHKPPPGNNAIGTEKNVGILMLGRWKNYAKSRAPEDLSQLQLNLTTLNLAFIQHILQNSDVQSTQKLKS